MFHEEPILEKLLTYTPKITPEPSIITFKPREHKKIIYLATDHINNEDHPIAQAIKNIIEHEKPDFCILEGFDPSEGISSPNFLKMAHELYAQKKFSESIYAALLCESRQIDFIGGDVRESSFLQPLSKAGFTEKDLIFFLLAQYFPQFVRDGITQQELPSYAEDILKNSIPYWLGIDTLYSYEEFLEWHEQHLGHPLNLVKDFPWEYDPQHFTPSCSEGASIYKRIQSHIMPLRDIHLINVIRHSIEKYNVIFVIFGASHYEWSKNALAYLFKEPVSRVYIKNNL